MAVESVPVSLGDCGEALEGEDIEDTGEDCDGDDDADDGEGFDISGCDGDDLEVSGKDLVSAGRTSCGDSEV